MQNCRQIFGKTICKCCKQKQLLLVHNSHCFVQTDEYISIPDWWVGWEEVWVPDEPGEYIGLLPGTHPLHCCSSHHLSLSHIYCQTSSLTSSGILFSHQHFYHFHITSSICFIFVAKLLQSLLKVSFFLMSMYSIIISYNNIIILTYTCQTSTLTSSSFLLSHKQSYHYHQLY